MINSRKRRKITDQKQETAIATQNADAKPSNSEAALMREQLAAVDRWLAATTDVVNESKDLASQLEESKKRVKELEEQVATLIKQNADLKFQNRLLKANAEVMVDNEALVFPGTGNILPISDYKSTANIHRELTSQATLPPTPPTPVLTPIPLTATPTEPIAATAAQIAIRPLMISLPSEDDAAVITVTEITVKSPSPTAGPGK